MVSNQMYRRMCQSGWMAAQERRKMDQKNAQAALDRRTRVMLEIEAMLRWGQNGWMFSETRDRFEMHPTKKAVIAEKITPIIQEFIDRGELVTSTEFFPKEGIYRTLLAFPTKVAKATKQRGLDL